MWKSHRTSGIIGRVSEDMASKETVHPREGAGSHTAAGLLEICDMGARNEGQ